MRTGINKDKAKAYLKEYMNNGFNKSQALAKVSKAKKESIEAHCTDFHRRVERSGVLAEFKLSDITPEYVIGKLRKEADEAKKSSDRREALNLLGRFLSLWKDHSIQEVSIKQDEESILAKYSQSVKRDTQLVK